MRPLQLLAALSGWVGYRYRETRAMTLAQSFQKRYSPNFRVFAGVAEWVSDLIDFGIFSAVGARFILSQLDGGHVAHVGDEVVVSDAANTVLVAGGGEADGRAVIARRDGAAIGVAINAVPCRNGLWAPGHLRLPRVLSEVAAIVEDGQALALGPCELIWILLPGIGDAHLGKLVLQLRLRDGR